MTSSNTDHDPTPVLTTIGDLNSPCWGDERDRIIHLEGTAVAQQAQMFIGLTVGAIMPWILGRTGAGWGFAIMSATAVGNLCYARYIAARGVKVHWAFESGDRIRGGLRLALLGLGVIGFIRATAGDGSPMSFDGDVWTIVGIVTGMAVGVGIAVAFVRWFQRSRQTDVPDDVFSET